MRRTCDALDKLNDSQARRSIIRAESVQQVLCRRCEHAAEFMLLNFAIEIRNCDRLEVGLRLDIGSTI